MDRSNTSLVGQFENTLEEYLYRRVPHLPAQWQELLVKIAPYLTILFVILSIPVILLALGAGAAFGPLALIGGGAGAVAGLGLAIIVFIISVVLEALAIPGLFARKKQGWRLLFYSTLVNAVYNIVTFNLFGFIIGTLLSLYLLFQIKSHYH
jgi:hypothetical protein